jgi:hypothetical protein
MKLKFKKIYFGIIIVFKFFLIVLSFSVKIISRYLLKKMLKKKLKKYLNQLIFVYLCLINLKLRMLYFSDKIKNSAVYIFC